MDVVELGFGEDVDTQAAAAGAAGVQVAFHTVTSGWFALGTCRRC